MTISTWQQLDASTATGVHGELESPRKVKGCWATLMTGDGYLPGLAVFSHTLLRSAHASAYPLVVMIARNSCSPNAVEVVRQLGCQVVFVDRLDPPVVAGVTKGTAEGKASTGLAWARFSEVWTKLRVWELDQAGYERAILVDSDMLVTKNMDELMDTPDLPLATGLAAGHQGIAACFACTCNPAKIASYPPEWVPSSCAFTAQTHPSSLSIPPLRLDRNSPSTHHLINSGLVVLKPSSSLFHKQMIPALASDPRVPHYRFPDQDFLADFFQHSVVPLPYVYNALKKLRGAHTNIWRDSDVKNIHYIHVKPWESKPGGGRDKGGPDEATHSWWWEAWLSDVQPTRGGGVSTHLWKSYVERFVLPGEAQDSTGTSPAVSSKDATIGTATRSSSSARPLVV